MQPITGARIQTIKMNRRSKRVKFDPPQKALSPEPSPLSPTASHHNPANKASSAKKTSRNRRNRKPKRKHRISHTMSKSAQKSRRRSRSKTRREGENGTNASAILRNPTAQNGAQRRRSKRQISGKDYHIWEKSEMEKKAETLSQRYSQCLENYQKSVEDPFEKFGAMRFGQKWVVYMNRLMNYPRYINSSYLVTMNHFTCSSRGKPLAILYTSFGYERECVEKLLNDTKVGRREDCEICL